MERTSRNNTQEAAISKLENVARQTAVAAFLAFWLAPVLYAGFTNHPAPWIPLFLQRGTDISRLFSAEQKIFAVYAIEFQRKSRGDFEILDEARYFHMQPFGRRTRLQRMLALANEKQREQLCLWIRQSVEQDIGEKIAAIRIVSLPFRVTLPANGDGYRQPSLSSVPLEDRNIIAAYSFDQ